MKRGRAGATMIIPQSPGVFCHLCKRRKWRSASPICSHRVRRRCRTNRPSSSRSSWRNWKRRRLDCRLLSQLCQKNSRLPKNGQSQPILRRRVKRSRSRRKRRLHPRLLRTVIPNQKRRGADSSVAYCDGPIIDRQMAPAFFDLSARAKLRLTGTDRVLFLNGQTTNDVRRARAEATQESCMLNAKGHLDAHLFLFATPNDIWIDTDEELREQLRFRLERYVIADDVVIDDVTDQFALLHFFSAHSPEGMGAEFGLKSQRLTNDGWDFWFRTTE